jgi:acyl-CoA synthetase (NDP forming)
VKILLEDENIDILIPISFPPSNPMDTWSDGFNQSFLPMLHTTGKPVIPITFREVSDNARGYYRDHGVYFIDHVEDGFKAVSHLIRYAEFLRGCTMKNTSL